MPCYGFFVMPKITALKQQQRNKERVSLFLDDAFAFGVPAIVAVGLRVGQILSAEEIAVIQDEAALEAGKQSAFRFLAHRPRSEWEIRRNLQGKEYAPAIIDAVIVRLTELKLCDDWEFSRYWVRQREQFKPRSPFVLSQELRQKGVESEIIDEVLNEVDVEASARNAAEKRVNRWQHLDEEEFRNKMSRYLAGRGFAYGVVRDVVRELWERIMEERAEESEQEASEQ